MCKIFPRELFFVFLVALLLRILTILFSFSSLVLSKKKCSMCAFSSPRDLAYFRHSGQANYHSISSFIFWAFRPQNNFYNFHCLFLLLSWLAVRKGMSVTVIKSSASKALWSQLIGGNSKRGIVMEWDVKWTGKALTIWKFLKKGMGLNDLLRNLKKVSF